jgi:nucleotide-binding universal stress UspA family protein
MTGRIVVGVDGSSQSRAALRWAVDEARLRGDTLEVVLAWRPPAAAYDPAHLPPFEDLEGAARATLVDLMAAEELSESGDPPTSAMPAQGHPAQVLTESAQGADLLVVGARGWGTFKGLLLGSVSQHCVTHAPCSVVVVRQPADAT